MGRATQQFIADVLTKKPDTIYRLDDYPTMRHVIYDNVKNAISRRFPLRNAQYTLGLEDVDYDGPEDADLTEQKRAIMEGKSVTRKLKGSWVLRDADTDKVVSKSRRMTLMRVPIMTDRGTFIRNGREFVLGNIMRMEPGVYTKIAPDTVSAQFNIKQGTGRGFNLNLDPKTGLFRVKQSTTNAPAYTVFKDMGVTDDQMRDMWGDDVFEKNRAAGQSEKARQAADKLYNG